MSRLLELLNNVSTFNYYTGRGNFNQNNLPFGPDRADSGYSGQPYIKKPKYATSVTGLTDVITHSATDVLRMTKFLADVPRGPLFIAKQIGLQMTNPKMQSLNPLPTDQTTSGQGFLKNISNSVTKSANGLQNLVGSNRIWTPKNFLAQIGGAGIGKNFARQGLTLDVPKEEKNWYIVDQIEKKSNGQDNRIVKLYKGFATGRNLPEEPKIMFKYTGGPGSYLGLGSTEIRSYYSTVAASDKSIPSSRATLNGFTPMTPFQLLNIEEGATVVTGNTLQSDGTGGFVSTATTKSLRNIDFRAYKASQDPEYAKELKDKNVRITDYEKYNVHRRIGVINTNEKSFARVLNDQVNMVAPYYSDAPSQNGKLYDMNGRPVTKEGIRDLIKFRIKVLDNDAPGKGVYLVFRAFINEFTDTMNAEWKPVKYTGRGETFYNYEGFNADYSLNFTVVAFSKAEMKPLYQKLNYLKSSLAPDYKNNRMRGNLVEMTVGDYLKYQPGIIPYVSIGVPENAQWEIAMTEPDLGSGGIDADMHELPQILRVSLTFNPIYNFLPKKSVSSPFIGIDSAQPGLDQDWTAVASNSSIKP